MEIRQSHNARDVKQYDTQRLRDEFLIDNLFAPGEIRLVYCHDDRVIVGSACPSTPLQLSGSAEIKASYFLERRELGAINIGGPGIMVVDGARFEVAANECIYAGMGVRDIAFESADRADPAAFYLVSAPAHASLPTTRISLADAAPTVLGSRSECNRRTIRKYIHAQGVRSCQLVMGMTALEEGSVWNTMPCHTHERRMEVYLYFRVPADGMVFHYMGQPSETRHIVVRDRQAVISPSWSIHAGCGTKNYAFIWGMAGENQVFADMDAVGAGELY
jgi:4-deoxy-L-threo-5-hexosulose-uronate ketol-isomerase